MIPAELFMKTLEEVDWMLMHEKISEGMATEYVKGWNTDGYKFTRAVVRNGRIKNFDFEKREQHGSLEFRKEFNATWEGEGQ